MVVIGYVNTKEVMPHMLDKERSSKLILSTTNMVLAVVAADTVVQSIILISIFSYQYSILTSDKEGQRRTQRDRYNWR
ncbi:MAG: hypothetical protein M3P08_06075 [Thermoproteota archaeon]|nr:hypothetical protein [Thermoproteota archaeon]